MGHSYQFHTIYSGLPVNLIAIEIALPVLISGPELYRLFVGAAGFIYGLYFSPCSFYMQPEWVMLLIGLIAGIAGAIFAVFLQRFAVISGGFFRAAVLF